MSRGRLLLVGKLFARKRMGLYVLLESCHMAGCVTGLKSLSSVIKIFFYESVYLNIFVLWVVIPCRLVSAY
jgi:hypothetical protein